MELKAYEFEFELIDETTGISSGKQKLDIMITGVDLIDAAKNCQAHILDKIEGNYAVIIYYNGEIVDF
jgi:hypothetical protein